MKPRILIAAAILVGVTIGIFSLACGKGKTQSTINVSGNIEVIQIEASFRVAGKVLERPVDEGQIVEQGQLIARLDSKDLEQQVAMRRADAATAKAALSAALSGSRKEEIEASKAAMEQAEADLKRLEPDEQRVRDLYQKGILPVRDYEATHASFEAAKAKFRQAEQQYTLIRKGPRPEDIDQTKARYEQANQALALAQTQLGYATLVAPVSGIILSKNVEPNEYVAPGTSVVTLTDIRHVWLRAYIEETDLGRVKVGQKAILHSDTYSWKTYEGRVSFISSEAEFTPKSVQTRKERVKLVYRIKIDVPNPTMELKPGMPADAEIIIGKAG